jgi:hypothetical protein
MNDTDVLDRLLDHPSPAEEQPSDEVRLLAHLAGALREESRAAQRPVMRAAAREALRDRLVRQAAELPTARPPLLTRMRDVLVMRVEGWAYSARLATASGLSAALLSGGGVAVAADQSVPGDLFYGVKLAY